MKVVLDTNIVFRTKQRLLLGVEIELLEIARTKTPVTIVVPSIVRKELIALYRRTFREELTSWQEHSSKLRALLPEDAVQVNCVFDESQAVVRYENLLDQRIAALGAECPSYKDVPHDVLIDRCLEPRKPFKSSGLGYRDSLIWETLVREVAEPNHVTVFISDNARDFADNRDKNKLHPDLIEDLSARGLAPDSVSLCSSVDDFNKRYILPELESLERVAELIDRGDPAIDLESFMMENYESAMMRVQERTVLDDRELSRVLGEKVFGARIIELDLNVCSEGRTNVRRLDERTLVADLPGTRFCQIEFLIDRDAARQLLAKNVIVVEDMAWNELMVHACVTCEVAFSLQVILDEQRLSCSSWDVSPVTLKNVWSQDELMGG